MNETEIFNSLLEKGNKTQVELAEELGTTKQHVYLWKSGKQGVRLSTLHKIAKALGLQILIKIVKK